jgi:hypothetical protein
MKVGSAERLRLSYDFSRWSGEKEPLGEVGAMLEPKARPLQSEALLKL